MYRCHTNWSYRNHTSVVIQIFSGRYGCFKPPLLRGDDALRRTRFFSQIHNYTFKTTAHTVAKYSLWGKLMLFREPFGAYSIGSGCRSRTPVETTTTEPHGDDVIVFPHTYHTCLLINIFETLIIRSIYLAS